MRQNDTKIKYFLYARKSSETEDRQVASIEAQINELQKVASQNDLEIIEILSESRSAKAPGRPVFNSMMERLTKGEADGILCWKLNRLARNPIDGGQISWMLQESAIKHIQTFGRSYYPNDNVLIMAVELGMANQFIRDLSVDTKRGLKAKAERGWFPTFPPLGYTHNPYKRKGEKEIIKDDVRFDLTRKMFDLMLSGNYTPPRIAEMASKEWGLKNQFGRKVGRSTLYRIFSNSFYYGTFEYPQNSGNWYKGNHEPMLTAEEYDKIQLILGKDGKPRPKTHEFAFTGLMRCGECGAMITAEDKVKRQKNGNIHYYTYYHCTKRKTPDCSQKSIHKSDLEKQVMDILGTITIPPEFCEWALEAIKKENKEEAKSREQIISNQQKEYNKCLTKIDGLIDMRANQELTQEEFSRRKEILSKEKMRLKELLDDANKNADDWIAKAEKLFNFAETAKKRFDEGGLKVKREILNSLGSNLLLKDGLLSISIQKPLLKVKEAISELDIIYKRLEPLKNGLDKKKMGEIFSHNPVLLPLWEKFRIVDWEKIKEELNIIPAMKKFVFFV